MNLFSITHTLAGSRVFSSCLVALLIIGVAFLAFPVPASAQIPFGGPILSVMWCVCSFNLLVVIGPPVPVIAMYQPGLTILYLFGQIWRPGAWTLGLWTPQSSCWQPWGPYGSCIPIAFPPHMIMVGTSM